MGTNNNGLDLKAKLMDEDSSFFEHLVFEDLDIGDTFILFPMPGDNSGHGGYKGGSWVFEKIKAQKPKNSELYADWYYENAKNYKTKDLLRFGDTQPVYKVFFKN